MFRSRQDYLLRLIEELTQFLARAVFQRQAGREREALSAIVESCERLFGLEAAQLFQFTPDQHFVMLTDGEAPDNARAKVLIYAALTTEAGQNYASLGKAELARASFLSALRLTLRARESFPTAEPPPSFAPSIPDLLAQLRLHGQPLDAETSAWLRPEDLKK